MSTNPRRSLVLHLLVSVVSLSIAGAMYGCGSTGGSAENGNGGFIATNGLARSALHALGSLHLGVGPGDRAYDASTADLRRYEKRMQRDRRNGAHVAMHEDGDNGGLLLPDSLGFADGRYGNYADSRSTASPGTKSGTTDGVGAPVVVDVNPN
jgi:hypothetical protein